MMINFFYFLIWIFLFKIAYIDLKTQYIWDSDVLVVAVLAMVANLMQPKQFVPGIYGFSVALSLGFVIFVVVKNIYGEEAFGCGDVLLLAAIGMLVKWPNFLGYFTIFAEFGGLVAVPIYFLNRTSKIYLPLSPILVSSLALFFWMGKPSLIDIIKFLGLL
jgi:Flp pilus assembly protein protease CpaA